MNSTILRLLAKNRDIPIQDFIVKNDSPCGSTIGPALSCNTGIKTIDIGTAMLAMHSIRETSGVLDALYYLDMFEEFFAGYEKLPIDLLDA